MASTYDAVQVGAKYTYKYSVFAIDRVGKRLLSYWHDIPLFADRKRATVNFVCEIPRNSRAKMEVVADVALTPIKQDTTSDGALRFYSKRIEWNYGMLPMTWEDPAHTWPTISGLPGDGDPLDVIEISKVPCEIGGVYEVKVLGAYALIDDGEVDWKILCIRCDAIDAHLVNGIQDVERMYPGELGRIKNWFRDYKLPKCQNAYGLGGHALDAATARDVINLTNSLYLASRREASER